MPPELLSAAPSARDHDLSVASARGYAVGFAIAIMLIVLVLAALVLLLRFFLRGKPDEAAELPSFREPMLRSTASLAAGGNTPRLAGSGSSPGPGAPPALRPLAPVLLEAVSRGASAIQAHARPAREPARAADGEQENCAALLRQAGWEASVRPAADPRRADMVAMRRGRVMALCCLVSGSPVEEQDVEEACVARERERADLAVIVSNAAWTRGARQLAARTGVELLRREGLRAFLA